MIKTWLKYIITEIAIDKFFKSLIKNFQFEKMKHIFKKHQRYSTITVRQPYYEFDEPRYVYNTYLNCVILKTDINWIKISYKGSHGYDCKRDGTDIVPYSKGNHYLIIAKYIELDDIVEYAP